MRFSKPCARASRWWRHVWGGIPEAVQDGVTGLLAPVGNTEALRDCLARLIADPARRAQYGAAGRERFLGRFTLDRMIGDTVRVYREVIEDAPAQRRDPIAIPGRGRRNTAPPLAPSSPWLNPRISQAASLNRTRAD